MNVLVGSFTRALVVTAVALSGCGGDPAGAGAFDTDSAELEVGAALGAGRDAADRSCGVVLRSMNRVALNGGWETKCSAGRCQLVWVGVIDVADRPEFAQARPGVLYKNTDATSWTRVWASDLAEKVGGYRRFGVRLEKNTLGDGLSNSALQRAQLQVAPFIQLPSTARLFDKQRGQGDFDNYVIAQSTGWQVAAEASICAPAPTMPAELHFQSGFRQEQHGALVANGRGVITYALDRLPSCRSTHNGHPAWDLRAFVRFSPGGQVVEGSVRGFNAVNGGAPTNSDAVSVPFAFTVPSGASSAEVWFKNESGAGSDCVTYDSNFGSNYRFHVEAAMAPVAWVGNPGSSFSRACSRSDGAPLSSTLDSYLYQRACAWVDVEVYVPGLTDRTDVRPEAVFAQAELTLDGVALSPQWLTFVERVGNNYRYRFQLPKSDLYYGPKWVSFSYTLRFSTDGERWLRETTRTVVRDASFCNPAWASCALD